MTTRNQPALRSGPSFLQRALACFRLPHFTPVVLVLLATTLLAWVIEGSTLTRTEFTRLLVAMLGSQLIIGIVNELVDAPVDGLTKPDKPIPAGLVSLRTARILALGALALMFIAGVSFGPVSFVLLLTGTFLGVAYSFWFKRTRFAWFPYLLALPLVPIWVAVSFDRFDSALLLLYPLGAFAVFGLQIAQSLPDIEADRAAGINSLTTRLGERRSIWLCWGSMLCSTLLVLLATASLAGVGSVTLLITGATVILLASDMVLYIRKRDVGIMAAFPCLAVSTGLLAIAWINAL